MTFFQTQEELQAFLEERQQHALMHTTDNTHLVNELLDTLDADQLQALDLILAHASDPGTNMYFRGQISAIQRTKFGNCECHQSHDPTDLLKEPVEPDDADPMQRVRDEMVEATMPDPTENLSPEYLAELDEYGLEQDEAGSLRCANCLVPYISLADRKLKEPGIGGCSGCQQKSAWG